jgi:hypothetical protein
MPPGSPAEPVLAAWGITTDGKPAFIGPAPGSGESAGAWHDFLADLNTHDRLTLQDSERGECRSGGPDYADLSAIYAPPPAASPARSA